MPINNKFKLELDMAYPHIGIHAKYFNSLKSLNQWLKRNEDALFTCVESRKYMLTDNGYERFHIYGNMIVSLSELINLANNLINNEENKQKFIEDLKKRNLQKQKSEE